MKVIPLRDLSGLKTIEVIRAVIERPPNGANVSEVRARCRVLDALDKLAPDAERLILEDADHQTLARAVNNFQFGAATREILMIADDVIDAKEPPAAV